MIKDKDIIVNRVANSGILTINLEHYYPAEEIVVFDIKDYLFKELILKEKDFRQALKAYDWTQLSNKILIVDCTADAIIPIWAYMLVSAYATDHASTIWHGTKTEFLKYHYATVLPEVIKTDEFAEKRVVIKGCSDKEVPPSAYALAVELLKPHAQSIMFGEPCSTVPIFKRPRKL